MPEASAVPQESVDVLIIGAGVSAISTGAHLKMECAGTSFLMLESRPSIGGTWDFFKYPGVRSDSDMFTFGFRFKPWLGEKTLADAGSILAYLNETIDEYDLRETIRTNSRVLAANWSSADSRWHVTVKNNITGDEYVILAKILHSASGYYSYERPHSPEFPGRESFKGEVIHPQLWPEGFDYADKRVVVIGSGATAITLVPELAKDATHVTMLQRTPTYILSLPGTDPIARFLRRVLPEGLAYKAVRWKNVAQFMITYQLSKAWPSGVKKLLRKMAVNQLPEGFDVDKHFSPPYDPWDQRLCVVPDGDFFEAIRKGDVEIQTAHIKSFDETGIELETGEHLDADVIVTATGFDIELFGGTQITVDGQTGELGELFSYKGMAVSGVPNFTFTIGYSNASWTLKADLVSEYVCRLINHMNAKGFDTFTPVAPATFKETSPFIDLTAGYVQRGIADAPRQGDAVPWRVYQNYPRDAVMFRRGELEDGAMQFARATDTVATGEGATPVAV